MNLYNKFGKAELKMSLVCGGQKGRKVTVYFVLWLLVNLRLSSHSICNLVCSCIESRLTCKLGESMCVFYLKISIESTKNIKSHIKKKVLVGL
jgi:Na+/H+ antiporter NhaA